jgi:hypothetical protein
VDYFRNFNKQAGCNKQAGRDFSVNSKNEQALVNKQAITYQADCNKQAGGTSRLKEGA